MSKPPRHKYNATRSEAWRLMDGVVIGQKLMAELVSEPKHTQLDPSERAAALRIANAGLRFADRADWAMKGFLTKSPHATVRNLLRLGVVEVCAFGAARHGVVNDLVALAGRSSRTAGLKGLVNAVLRKTLDKVEGNWDKAPVPRLPKWLRKPLSEAYGNGTIQSIEKAHSIIPPLDLTVKDDPQGWAEKLEGTVLPSGTVRIKSGQQVSKLAGFETGDWWVQDAASAMPVLSVDVVAGASVLDLCAAPGGKTMQLAQAGAAVRSVDLSGFRMTRVTENLERTQLSADVLVGDVFDQGGETFDLVVLDAPCSATGTIRRHPDLCHARDGAEIGSLIELQSKMLDHAAGLVASNGTLLFCTCSLLPDEGEVQVEEFLAKHSDFTAQPVDSPWVEESWRTEEGGIRLRPDFWPDQGGMDGFYFAKLCRK